MIPLGSGQRHCVDLGLERDIDVLFLGTRDVPRRQRMICRLERAGVDVDVRGSWTDRSFWGDERLRLLNRTKILVNFGRFAGHLPGHRFVVAMGAGALVVSEPVYRPEPYVPGVHYSEAPPDELPAAIRRYLADDDARRNVAANGHQLSATR